VPAPESVPAAEAALTAANAAVRAWVQGLPPYAQWSLGQKARLNVLLDAFNNARDRLREAQAREAEDDPVPAAA
jgi:hypothetical protein